MADIRAAADAAEHGDCAEAARLAGATVDGPDARTLPPAILAAGLHLAATCEAQLGREEDGYRHALAGTALNDASDQLWLLRFAFELQAKRHDSAVATVEAMTRGRGAALNAIPIEFYYRFDNELKQAGSTALRRRLLSVLAGDSYSPDEPGATVDGFWRNYAELLIQEGNRAVAASLVQQIDYPPLLLDISLDQRLRDFLPPDFNLRRSTEAALVRSRAIALQHPELIQPVNDVATYLRLLGRPKESIDALEALRPSIADPAKFEDHADQLIWWWDSLSRGHQMLGQYDAAIDTLRKGSAAEEKGGLNVSQVINLSELQMTFGHPAETLSTLRAFEESKRDVSPFGTMQIVLNRGCAKALLGKPSDAVTELAFARAHAKDAPEALTRLLLCLGDRDGAAMSLIARLDDPDQRLKTLKSLSEFDEPPVRVPPDPTKAGLQEIKARADVKAAIARAGGTRRFNVQNITF